MQSRLYMVVVVAPGMDTPPQVGFVRSEKEPWGIEALKALDFSYDEEKGHTLWIMPFTPKDAVDLETKNQSFLS